MSVTGQPVAFKAFVDNGFDGVLVGVNGGVVNYTCGGPDLDPQTGALVLAGNASNGLAKSNFNFPSGNEETDWSDDLDSGEFIILNGVFINGNGDAIGHAEFTNGQDTRTMTVNYMTEDGGVGPSGDRSDCMATGSVIKGIY